MLKAHIMNKNCAGDSDNDILLNLSLCELIFLNFNTSFTESFLQLFGKRNDCVKFDFQFVMNVSL